MSIDDDVTTFPFSRPERLWDVPPDYARLRAEAPATKVRLPGGLEAWLVTRHAEARQVLVDPRFSRALAATGAVARMAPNRILNSSLIGTDPPDHTRLRRLVAHAFTARRMEALRPRVVAELDRLFDALVRLPRPVDLVAHLTRPMPFEIMAELLGAPHADWPRLHQLSEDVLAGPWSDPEQVAAADAELVGYLDRLLAAKAAAPAEDLLSVLVTAREDDDQLSHREIVELAVLLLVSGHESTTTLLGHCILTLLRERDQWERLLADPGLVPAATEELLRLQRRTEVGDAFPRVAAEDVDLGGVLVKAGDVVIPALDSADRDPAVFDHADRLDFDRPANPHLVFGAGVHRCIGAQLALMEIQEALRGLLARFPTLRLGCPPEELRLNPRLNIRTLEALPVTW